MIRLPALNVQETGNSANLRSCGTSTGIGLRIDAFA